MEPDSPQAQLLADKLEDIEAILLDLEGPREAGTSPSASIPVLFRDFHNLKSMLSAEGVEHAAKLVHKAESCLDALRAGRASLDPAWIDGLIATVDHLRSVVRTGRDSESPELARRLDSLLKKTARQTDTEAATIPFRLLPPEARALQESLSAGMSGYLLTKLLSAGLDEGRIPDLPVFDSIRELGIPVAWRLARPNSTDAVLSILFCSDSSPKDLSFVLFDPFHPVRAGAEEPASPAAAPASPASPAAPATPVAPAAPPPGDTAAPGTDAANSALKLTRILIVEDEPVSLLLMQRFLSPYGRIDTAKDGLEAIEKFRSSLGGGDPYDAVFLDIMMPGASGSLVLEEIRTTEQASGIATGEGARVIMASSLSDYTSISASFKNQGDAYLVKPLDSDSIDAVMAKYGFKKVSIKESIVPKAPGH